MPARGIAPGIVPPLAIRPVGAEDPCAPAGRSTFRLASATQGVALGLHPPALSAPEDEILAPYLKNRSVNIFVPAISGYL